MVVVVLVVVVGEVEKISISGFSTNTKKINEI